MTIKKIIEKMKKEQLIYMLKIITYFFFVGMKFLLTMQSEFFQIIKRFLIQIL